MFSSSYMYCTLCFLHLICTGEYVIFTLHVLCSTYVLFILHVMYSMFSSSYMYCTVCSLHLACNVQYVLFILRVLYNMFSSSYMYCTVCFLHLTCTVQYVPIILHVLYHMFSSSYMYCSTFSLSAGNITPVAVKWKNLSQFSTWLVIQQASCPWSWECWIFVEEISLAYGVINHLL